MTKTAIAIIIDSPSTTPITAFIVVLLVLLALVMTGTDGLTPLTAVVVADGLTLTAVVFEATELMRFAVTSGKGK